VDFVENDHAIGAGRDERNERKTEGEKRFHGSRRLGPAREGTTGRPGGPTEDDEDMQKDGAREGVDWGAKAKSALCHPIRGESAGAGERGICARASLRHPG
jgi:hypothetical protein